MNRERLERGSLRSRIETVKNRNNMSFMKGVITARGGHVEHVGAYLNYVSSGLRIGTLVPHTHTMSRECAGS